MKSAKEVIEVLKKEGMRITEPTKAIVDIIFDRKDSWHPRAEDILHALAKKKKRISQATVYNVLNKLYAVKMLQEVTLEKGQRYFDTNLDVHYHLYHEKSEKLEDIQCDLIDINGVEKIVKMENVKKIDIIIHIDDK